jgi:hypothetical protein
MRDTVCRCFISLEWSSDCPSRPYLAVQLHSVAVHRSFLTVRPLHCLNCETEGTFHNAATCSPTNTLSEAVTLKSDKSKRENARHLHRNAPYRLLPRRPFQPNLAHPGRDTTSPHTSHLEFRPHVPVTPLQAPLVLSVILVNVLSLATFRSSPSDTSPWVEGKAPRSNIVWTTSPPPSTPRL